jgi:hypothetical protein
LLFEWKLLFEPFKHKKGSKIQSGNWSKHVNFQVNMAISIAISMAISIKVNMPISSCSFVFEEVLQL